MFVFDSIPSPGLGLAGLPLHAARALHLALLRGRLLRAHAVRPQLQRLAAAPVEGLRRQRSRAGRVDLGFDPARRQTLDIPRPNR